MLGRCSGCAYGRACARHCDAQVCSDHLCRTQQLPYKMLLILTQVAAVTPHVLALIVAFGSISPVFMSTTRFVVQCTMSFYQWIPAQHVCSQCAAAGVMSLHLTHCFPWSTNCTSVVCTTRCLAYNILLFAYSHCRSVASYFAYF